MPPHVIFVHGGSWFNNIYKGGTKEYIPMPVSGLRYIDLLSKIEDRLMKDQSMYQFDIVALVKDDEGGFMRFKVTDDYEWSILLDTIEIPILYVDSSPKCIPSKPIPSNDLLALDVRGYDPLASPSDPKRVSSQPKNGGSPELTLLDHVAIPIRSYHIDTDQLKSGTFFSNKDSMISAIHSYHLKNHVEFRTNVSDLRRYHAQCKYELSCVFSLRSKSFGRLWKIYEHVGHTCMNSAGVEPKVTSRAIADYVAPSMTEDGFIVRPRDIQGQFLRECGVRLKYSTALKGKNRALKKIYGDHKKSFQVRNSQF